MKFDDIKVGPKMWGVVLGLMVVLLVTTGAVQYSQDRLMTSSFEIVKQRQHIIAQTLRWEGLTERMNERTWASVHMQDEALVQRLVGQAKAATAEIVKIQDSVRESLETQAEKDAFEQIYQARLKARATLDKLNELKAAGDQAAFMNYSDTVFVPAANEIPKALNELVTIQEQALAQAIEAQNAQHSQIQLIATLVIVGLFGFAVLIVSVLVRSITTPLRQTMEVAKAIGDGDLTKDVSVSRKDEFGDLLTTFSGMTARLRGLVSEVRTGIDSVSTASSQIANGNQDLSTRTEQTAANLQQTAASIEQLTSNVTQSAETARQANQLALNATQAATRGGEVMGAVVNSMSHISDSSRRIADIIGVIDGIAFQTNILALNAAVEAARAGEQGRGFAVVASEVRSLAHRSAEAAKEIKTLIQRSVDSVETGSQQVSEAGAAMQDIVNGVQRVGDLIAEISAASGEQQSGISQVNHAVSNLDQMTQQNAALVEESAAAASAMNEQARKLGDAIGQFRVGSAGSYQGAAKTTQVRVATVPSQASLHTNVASAKPVAVAKPQVRATSLAVPPRTEPSDVKQEPKVVKKTESLKRPAVANAPAQASAPVHAPAATPARVMAKAPVDDDDWETF